MLTQSQVKTLFRYKNGKLFWRIARSNCIKIGDEAGCANGPNGCRVIGIGHRNYLAHRVIFLWHRGYMPNEIDHKDHDTRNNRMSNLREVTHLQNMQNMKPKRGTTFIKKYGKWQAQIMVNRKNLQLGWYSTEEEAHAAYVKAKRKFHTN